MASRTAAVAGASALVVAALLLAGGGHGARVSLGIQSLRLVGLDGSGDISAFAPAGDGMDSKTAVDDDESITSSIEKALHPPKPRAKPAFEVVGKDGQTYASIPADIMAKFAQARMGSASSAGASQPHQNAPTKPTPRRRAMVTPSAPAAASSSQPPAWVVAEAEKLRAESEHGATQGGQVYAVSAPAAAAPKAVAVSALDADKDALQRSIDELQQKYLAPAAAAPAKAAFAQQMAADEAEAGPKASDVDTYDTYKAEYEAAMRKRDSRADAPAATSGDTKTVVSAQPSSEQARETRAEAEEISKLQQQIALQTQQRDDQVAKLMHSMQLLTKAVIQMKMKAPEASAARSPALAPHPSAQPQESHAIPVLPVGVGRGAPVEQQPQVVRKAEWDEMQARLAHKSTWVSHDLSEQEAQASGRVAAPAPARTMREEEKAKLSYFGLLRQEQGAAAAGGSSMGAARLADAPNTFPSAGGGGDGGGGVKALGDNDDLRVGYMQQQQREAAEGGSPAPGGRGAREGEGDQDAHSKLSFWARARNERSEAESSGRPSAAMARMVQRAQQHQLLLSGQLTTVAPGVKEERATAPPAAGACVAPACTCVPHDTKAIRQVGARDGSGLALTQLRGLGAQAGCVYYSARGPTGHRLSVTLHDLVDPESGASKWENYGAVATGCLSVAKLERGLSVLAVQDTITGDSHRFALMCAQ